MPPGSVDGMTGGKVSWPMSSVMSRLTRLFTWCGSDDRCHGRITLGTLRWQDTRQTKGRRGHRGSSSGWKEVC